MMIELTFSAALLLYLGLTLISLLALWGWGHFFIKKKKENLCYDQALCLCEYCQYLYLKELEKGVTRCPKCGFFNKENSSQ